MKKVFVLGGIVLLVMSLLVGCSGSGSSEASSGSDYPQKSIEFVVPYSAGGGSDIIARQIADIAQKKEFTAQSVMVVNKPGASGGVGNAYVYGKAGDDYTLMTMNSGHALSARVAKADVTADMFTPIANVAIDNAFLAVKADYQYKTMEEIIEAAKANPNSISVGAVGKGSEDHLCYAMLQETGAQFKYISYEGSGDVVSAVLGGHVDIGIFNPSEFIGQVEAGQMVPVATYAPERLDGVFKDVPTFIELGYKDIEFVQFRSVLGAPDMSEEAAQYWSDVLKKVTETEEWQKDYLDKAMVIGKFMDSKEYAGYHAEQEKMLLEKAQKYGIIE